MATSNSHGPRWMIVVTDRHKSHVLRHRSGRIVQYTTQRQAEQECEHLERTAGSRAAAVPYREDAE